MDIPDPITIKKLFSLPLHYSTCVSPFFSLFLTVLLAISILVAFYSLSYFSQFVLISQCFVFPSSIVYFNLFSHLYSFFHVHHFFVNELFLFSSLIYLTLTFLPFFRGERRREFPFIESFKLLHRAQQRVRQFDAGRRNGQGRLLNPHTDLSLLLCL